MGPGGTLGAAPAEVESDAVARFDEGSGLDEKGFTPRLFEEAFVDADGDYGHGHGLPAGTLKDFEKLPGELLGGIIEVTIILRGLPFFHLHADRGNLGQELGHGPVEAKLRAGAVAAVDHGTVGELIDDH